MLKQFTVDLTKYNLYNVSNILCCFGGQQCIQFYVRQCRYYLHLLYTFRKMEITFLFDEKHSCVLLVKRLDRDRE